MIRDKTDAFMAGAIFIGLIGVIISFFDRSRIERVFQDEAVKHGAAEWVLVGEPPEAKFEFRWKQ